MTISHNMTMVSLKSYLDESKIPQGKFADAVGCTQSMISQLLTGRKKPGLDLAYAIERETAGQVPVTSWVNTNEAA